MQFTFDFQVSLQALLVESREQNKCLQFEVDDLKQKLQDARGDIKVQISIDTVLFGFGFKKNWTGEYMQYILGFTLFLCLQLLREQIARQRVGTTDEGINTRHFPAHERESLVKQLEDFRVQVNYGDINRKHVHCNISQFVTLHVIWYVD